MPRCVAFLRAINVGGHVVTMAELRRHFVSLGLTDAETFIASGNVLFTAGTRTIAALERKIEARLERALGYEVKTFIRTDAEVAAVSAHRAFPAARVARAGAYSVGFLREPLENSGVKALMGLKTDIDDFRVRGRELYWICKKGQGESEVSNMVVERTLKVSTTLRGLKTIAKLVAKYDLQ
jgi:uncharacterized protein (DUF1697 family)